MKLIPMEPVKSPAILLLLVCFLAFFSRSHGQTEKLSFFESKIRPVLVNQCYECHSETSANIQGGLRVDSRKALLKGGDTGPAVVPGKSEASLLLSALHYEDVEMPPSGRLPQRTIDDFEKWIRDGAIDPRLAPSDLPNESAAKSMESKSSNRSTADFWAFQTPTRQQLPQVRNRTWSINRIDRFVLHRMEQQGLRPTQPADHPTLARRLAFDLVGLPPDDFVEPKQPVDVDKLVDRLLQSPRFGEKWSRLWLDLSRYAEDQAHIVGNNKSLFFPNAWMYRDWVIEALNEDQGYDEFVQRQLAADLIRAEDEDSISESELVALGFMGLGPKYYRRNDLAVMADEWEDRIDTLSRGLLGLTAACARCHDHKYDPISTRDYHALAGIFASSELYNAPIKSNGSKSANGDKPKKPAGPVGSIHVVRDRSKPRNLNIFIRGNVQSKGELVPRGLPVIFRTSSSKSIENGSGRLQLAREITSAENPLFGRVMVNRIWDQLIGRPLVGTPSNFGFLGDRPSHPQLLDDLTVRFIESGWSLKWLIREIVSSATYQQATTAYPLAFEEDPQNRWISRMNRRRLTVEQWRDGVLQVCGQLSAEQGGRSIDPLSIDPLSIDHGRRTVYSEVSRFQLSPMLKLFDFPDPNTHSARRNETITPLQKMFVMNHPFVRFQAKQLDQDLDPTENLEDHELVQAAFRRVLGRDPNSEETILAAGFLHGSEESASGEKNARSRQIDFLHSLLISNEFLYYD